MPHRGWFTLCVNNPGKSSLPPTVVGWGVRPMAGQAAGARGRREAVWLGGALFPQSGPRVRAPEAQGGQELSEASAHLGSADSGAPRTICLKGALSPNSPLSLEPHHCSHSLGSSC